MSFAPSEARREKFLNLDHKLITEKHIINSNLDFRRRHNGTRPVVDILKTLRRLVFVAHFSSLSNSSRRFRRFIRAGKSRPVAKTGPK